MNPYDFVRVIWERPGARRQGPPHDRFQGLSGRIEGTLTALTPIFLPERDERQPRQFMYSAARGACIIPGASLKGMFRSLVETIDGGAWWFISEWQDKLPPAFRRPADITRLDAACRMFGFMGEKGGRDSAPILAGHVGFEDAVCIEARDHEPLITVALLSPKPHHSAWYLDQGGNMVAGRKYYFHARNAPIRTRAGARRDLGAHIKPLNAGSRFAFKVTFDNVAEDDLNVLLYAMVLEPTMRHKFGYAKPAGLGSVEVQLQKLQLIDRMGRYRAGVGGITTYEEDALERYIAGRIARYVNDRQSITLNDLRRIWAWPATHDIQYPGEEWFDEHPQTPIRATP